MGLQSRATQWLSSVTRRGNRIGKQPTLAERFGFSRRKKFAANTYQQRFPPELAWHTLEPLEPRLVLATASLGDVSHMEEGFGFGSTIDGLGQAIDLNGSWLASADISTNNLRFAETKAYTQEFWFYSQPALESEPIYGWQGLPSEVIVVDGGSGLEINGPAGPQIGLDNILTPDAWNHIAKTFDGTDFKVFINGVEKFTTDEFAGATPTEPAAIDLGRRDDIFADSDPGAIDELRFWNIARSQAEIQQSMLEILTGAEEGLVGYWRFEENPVDGTFVDSTANGNHFVFSQTAKGINNPAPQIGYVEVTVSEEVDTGIGLFVTYDIASTSTAQETADFLTSRFRTVSEDPDTEQRGVIIPDGETTGRIYFMARSDAIYEPDLETIDIELTTFDFAGSTYTLGDERTATIEITDNGAFLPGIAVFDADGRAVTPQAKLFVDPNVGRADFRFNLTSQPLNDVTLTVSSGPNADFETAAGVVDELVQTFTRKDWDVPRLLTLVNVSPTGDVNDRIIFQQMAPLDYLRVGPGNSDRRTFPFTTEPPDRVEVEEGNPEELGGVTPTVSLFALQEGKEGDAEGGLFEVFLDSPAPPGGLDVLYMDSGNGNAEAGADYDFLTGVVRVKAGEQTARILVDIVDDLLDEGKGETLSLSLRSGDGYVVSASNTSAGIQITDNDVAKIRVSNFTPTGQVPTAGGGEPGNTFETATQLGVVAPGTRITGQEIATADPDPDNDIYRFTIDDSFAIMDQILVSFRDADGDLDALLYDDDDTSFPLIFATSSDDNEIISLDALPAGDYFLEIFGDRGAVNSYTIEFFGSDPAHDFLSPIELGEVTPGRAYSGTFSSSFENDYFRFTLDDTVAELSSVTVEFENVNVTNQVRTRLSTGTGDLLAAMDGPNVLFGLNALTRPADYLLSVANLNGPVNKYTITFTGTLSDSTGGVGTFSETYAPIALEEPLGITETGRFGLRLTSMPESDVTLSLSTSSSSSSPEIQLSTATLTYVPNRWDQYQLVTVTPLPDQVADGDQFVTVTALAQSADPFYDRRLLQFDVLVIDNSEFDQPSEENTLQAANLPKARLTGTEVGTSEGFDIEFRVELSKAVSTDTLVGIQFDEDGAILQDDFQIFSGIETGIGTSGSTMAVRIPANQTSTLVRLATVDDVIDEKEQELIHVRLLQSREYILDASTAVPDTGDIDGDGDRMELIADFIGRIPIIDNDKAGIIPTAPTNVSVSEDGADASFEIELATQPTDDVVVYVASSDPSEGRITADVSAAPGAEFIPLTFTPQDWNRKQTVHVVGADDLSFDGDRTFKVQLSATSDDLQYRALAGPAIDFTNLDNDTVGILVAGPAEAVKGQANIFRPDRSEIAPHPLPAKAVEGKANILSVALDTQPLGEVRVTMTPINDQISISGAQAGDPVTLTFDASKWDIAQLVEVAALDDGVVEYFHVSQIRFTVETGREINGATVADISTPEQAFDLGDITGGVTWKGFPHRQALQPGAFFRFELAERGTPQDKIRTIGELSGLSVWHGSADPGREAALLTGDVISLDTLDGGEYLLRVQSQLRSDAGFTILFDSPDREFESIKPVPLDILIEDNDLPTASLVAGPAASEVFSEPSYFAVKLNAPARADSGDTGVKVHFQVVGGRATLGDPSSTKHDYSILADDFDPVTKTGWARVAPGDVQANIGIVPVDDKRVEDLALKLKGICCSGGPAQIQIAAADIAPLAPPDAETVLTEGTLIKGQFTTGEEIEFTVVEDVSLATDGTTFTNVKISISDADFARAENQVTEFKGVVASENIRISLLPAAGYLLPLAADNQDREPFTVGTTVGSFSGGDPDEGLDLDGNFLYAVNVRGPAIGPVRNAMFTKDDAPGVTVMATNQIPDWHNPEYGDSLNDDRLEQVMESIRFSGNQGTVGIDLQNLTPGNIYKLQLLFAESCCDRGFDIFVESELVADDFNIQQAQGGINEQSSGAVVTHQFVAGDERLNVVLNGAETTFPDRNPTLSGFTLETLSPEIFDRSQTQAEMTVFDDDVPGIRLVRLGDDGPIGEGETAIFGVSLVAEPAEPVDVTLIANSELVFPDVLFSDPNNPSQPVYNGTFEPNFRHQLNPAGVPADLDLRLDSFLMTDLGWTATFDARLRSVILDGTDVDLTLADTQGGGQATVIFDVPNEGDVDAAGLPVRGNAHQFQRLSAGNLTDRSDNSGEYFELTLTLDGSPHTIRIDVTLDSPQPATTKTLTFETATWFELQPITVMAVRDKTAEPGAWHEGLIATRLASDDANWDGRTVADRAIQLADVQLDGGETAAALTAGLGTLEDSLLSLELPLVGSILEFAPEVGDFFSQTVSPLVDAVKSQASLTVSSLKQIGESALGSVGAYFDTAMLTPDANEDEVTLLLELDKTWNLFDLSLATDLGVEALGLDFQTTGSLGANITFDLDFALGLHKDFGFFIDTDQTGLTVDATLNLQDFAGKGSLGFLQLDFADDSENPTELSVVFEAGLNDLDNYQTVQFFDVNGDGLLDQHGFQYGVGADTDTDGKLDLDDDGEVIRTVTSIAEPWVNLSESGAPIDQATGKALDGFPSVTEIAGTPVSGSSAVDWDGDTTFDEAESIVNEGKYRARTQGSETILYFDANNNGKLDIGRRNTDPFVFPWTSLTEGQKDKSEIWIATPNARWIEKGQIKEEFQIETKGTGANRTFHFDADGDNQLETSESISAKLRKKLDKNKDGTLEANIERDAEGAFVQGTGIAFDDLDDDGRLDFDEPFVNSDFGDFEFNDDSIITIVVNNTEVGLLDFNGDGEWTTNDPDDDPDEFLVLTTADGLRFVDLNGNDTLDEETDGNDDGHVDMLEPFGDGDEPLIVPAETSDEVGLIVTFDIVARDGKRIFEVEGDEVAEIGVPDLSLDNMSAEEVWGIEPWAESFAFYDADGDGNPDLGEFRVLTVEGTQFIDLDMNGDLTVDDDDNELEPTASQSNEFDTTDFPDTASVVELLNDGDRLTLTELVNFKKQVKSENTKKRDQLGASLDLFSYSFAGEANLGLKTKTSIEGSAAFPSFAADLAISFPLFNFGDEADAADAGFTIEFNNVTMDLGTFLGDFAAPVLEALDTLVTPIKPIIEVLNADTKLPAKIGLDSVFENDGRPGTSLLEIAQTLAGGRDPRIETAINYTNILTDIVETIDTLNGTLGAGDTVAIEFGDFSLSDLRAASDDEVNSAGSARQTNREDGQTSTTLRSKDADGTPSAQPLTEESGKARRDSMVADTKGKSSTFSKLSELDGFEFLLFNPDTALSLLMGENGVDLITYDVPDFEFEFDVSRVFNIWGPIAGLLEGGFHVGTDIAVGFDTAGVEAWAAKDFALDQSFLIFDGFFLNDWDDNGDDKNELFADAFVAAGAGINVGLASGFVRGGVEGTIGLDIVDTGERAGTSDGKIRGSDIIQAFNNNPLDLFELNGIIEAFLGAKIEVDFLFDTVTVWEADFARFKIAEFTLDASGFSGSSDFGGVVTGPVHDALVWFDVNDDGVFDEGEPFTFTDIEGNYQLIIPDGFDTATGSVRIQGGVDVSTGLPQTTTLVKNVGEHENITAFTTLAHFLEKVPSSLDFNEDDMVDDADQLFFRSALEVGDPLADLNQDGEVDTDDLREFELQFEVAQGDATLSFVEAEELILEAFGLNASIDVGSLDHFDEVLAENSAAKELFVDINALHTLVVKLRSLFAGAGGFSFEGPQASAIFSDAIYRAIANQVATGAIDLTNTAQLESIILDAMNLADQALIEAGYESGLNIEFLGGHTNPIAQVLAASTINKLQLASEADDGLEIAALITKSKVIGQADKAGDLYLFGAGNLSVEELLAHAATDESALQEIRATPLPPIKSHIGDFLISEDSSVTDFEFTVFDFETPGDELTFSIISDNPGLLPPENISVTQGMESHHRLLSFTPTADAFGTATVILIITNGQGQELAQDFTVTVNPVNDAPVAVGDVAESTSGFSTTFDVRANDSDVDGDELTAVLLDGISNGALVQNDDGSFTYTPLPGFVGSEFASYLVSDGFGGTDLAQVTLTALPDDGLLKVQSVAVTDGGVLIRFNRPVDEVPINLYAGVAASMKEPDLILTKDGNETVLGSLVIESDTVHFVATGGPLAPGEYRLWFGADGSGFRAADTGQPLDGNNDGQPGGNFGFDFEVEIPDGPRVSLPDFAASSGRDGDLPGDSMGLPVQIDDAADIRTAKLVLSYDPALLSIVGVSAGDNLPAGTSVALAELSPGLVELRFSSTDPLSAGPADLFLLDATVPDNAPYGQATILSLSEVSLNDATIVATTDEAVQAVTLPGDVTGNGHINVLDGLALRAYLRGNQGFEAYPNVDPVIVADLNGDGRVNLSDHEILLYTLVCDDVSCATLDGDANLDGKVDAMDLNTLARNWRESLGGWSNADFNADGQIDVRDLNLLALNWHKEISDEAAFARHQRPPRAPLAKAVAVSDRDSFELRDTPELRRPQVTADEPHTDSSARDAFTAKFSLHRHARRTGNSSAVPSRPHDQERLPENLQERLVDLAVAQLIDK